MSTRIYVASSWRNEYQPAVVADLRDAGCKVYDFRNPHRDDDGFHWSQIDGGYKSWDSLRYIRALEHPIAERGFQNDWQGMQWAQVCVLVLPCGRSAHLEAGWFIGAGKPLFVLIPPELDEPELMYKLAGHLPAVLHTSMQSLLSAIRNLPAAIA